jgi:hypothetical protein
MLMTLTSTAHDGQGYGEHIRFHIVDLPTGLILLEYGGGGAISSFPAAARNGREFEVKLNNNRRRKTRHLNAMSCCKKHPGKRIPYWLLQVIHKKFPESTGPRW